MTPVPRWLPVPREHPFGLPALPYGSFTAPDLPGPRAGVAVGDFVLDLTAASARLLPERAGLFAAGTLDALLAAGPGAWSAVRAAVTGWLAADGRREEILPLLRPAAEVSPRLPFSVADYVDFYACERHAANVGRIFRPGTEPLTRNWHHLPVGYHGRASSIVVSGTPVRRPSGQSRPPGAAGPVFGASGRLDFEAELGFVVGVPSELGQPVPAGRFADHVFGVCLVNDWSARDIQSWESAPLGPFLGKSFATTMSPWVVPLAALQQARVRAPSRDRALLPYLTESADWGLDIAFEIRVNGHVVSRPRYADMHWSPAQMLAHLTVNGARLRTGDLYASGTVSGPEPDQLGCLLELTWDGTRPLRLPGGTSRAWLQDGDEVTITATAPGPGGAIIGLGEARGRILPAS